MFEIITDATCDLPKDFFVRYNIKVVPLYIIKDNERIPINLAYDHKKCFYENKNLKELWLKGKLKTSQPSIKDFINSIKSCKSKDILIITLGSELSGTFNVANMVKKILEKQGYNIEILDSKTASIGLALYVKKAVELREKGYKLDEVIDTLKEVEVETYFCPLDIDFLFNSGRINLLKFAYLKISNKKPILCLYKGQFKLYKLSNNPLEDLTKLEEGNFLYGGTLNELKYLKEPKVLVNPIIAISTGPAFGIALIKP